jgi:hypothetical protein
VSITLSEVIPWGRSFEEYRLMFALSADDLGGSIVGCGDGPASFNAEATARGRRVLSCDPLYAFSAGDIERRARECYDTVISQVKQGRDGFVWGLFRDPDHLGECRLAALRLFLADFEKGRQEGRYVAASLPTLPFGYAEFSLAVVSHFLFLYSDRFDLDFHIASCEELLRGAGEVRVFPLLGLDRRRSPHVGPVIEHLSAKGLRAEAEEVPYEFQRGGNQVLRIRRGGPTLR